MINRPIQEENIIFINIYAPNTGESKYIKQILKDIKGDIDSNIIRARNFNTPLTSMTDHPERKSIRLQ